MTNKFREINLKNVAIITLGILIAYSILFINNSSNFKNFDKNCLKSAKVSGKILISGSTGWANAKNSGICSGFGTYSDPYIIEDLVIDGGGSGNCIWIQNSQLYFKIINCTISNAGENWGDGGIKLTSIANGHLINNTIISCYEGIILDSSHHIVISGNTANSNDYVGIGLWDSQNNIIKENTFRLNGWGISLESSNYNNIIENFANDNENQGIGIWNSINNLVSGNDLNNNDDSGVFLYNSDHNNISTNKIVRNVKGIYLEESDSNYISFNNIRYSFVGIDIYQSKCNDILNNTFFINNYNIRGTQDECVPDTPDTSAFPIEYVLIPVMIIVPIVLFAGLLRMKRIPPPRKALVVENFIEKFQQPEKPIRDKGPKPKTKSELLIKPKLEKLKDAKSSVPKEVSFEEEFLIEKQVVKKIPEEKPKEILSTEPQISHCPFCGLEIIEDASYCPQCGRSFKKK